jgi:hypothetical protein
MSDDLIVDLTNYKDRVGNRVAPARYTVVVEDAESDTARSGNPMVNLWLRVQGGEYDGATIVDRLVITEKSLFRVVGFMQAINLPTPKKRFKMNVRSFVGKRLDIDVEDGDPYNGRVKSEVRGYMRIVGESTGAGADDLSDLDTESETASAATEEEPVAETGAADPAASSISKEEPAPASTDDSVEIDLDEVDLG